MRGDLQEEASGGKQEESGLAGQVGSGQVRAGQVRAGQGRAGQGTMPKKKASLGKVTDRGASTGSHQDNFGK